MSLRWAESGGGYHGNTGNTPGVMGPGSNAGTSTNLLSRNGSTIGYGQNNSINTPLLTTTGFTGGVFGYAAYAANWGSINGIIRVWDNTYTEQCSIRTNAGSQVYCSRNGVNLGAGNPTLGPALTPNVWHYIEFKVSLSITATGTCEIVVDGVTVLTLTSVQNATTAAKWYACNFYDTNTGAGMMDMYVLDTDSGGANSNYLGDVQVCEFLPNAAGANAGWSVGQGSFTLTSVANASAGTTVYTGTITNGALITNMWQGYYFIVTGFTNSANNGTFLCSASTATTLTLVNATGVAETHAATAAFQNPCQIGIHSSTSDGYAITNVGTRPPVAPNDPQYIASLTGGAKHDFAHPALSLAGSIPAVIHRTWARKDDAGVRTMQQICLQGATQETGPSIGLATSGSYYDDILQTDPNGATWTPSLFNTATFGVTL